MSPANTRVAELLLKWYAVNARDLPWRRRVTPYRTWISEVMLQQTRVEAVIPYYLRWMRRFPSMRKLAASSERSVLSLWEGLGYYSRALNLHRVAKILVRRHGGRLPSDPAALRALPGIGEYTAAAVASIAYGRDLAALDSNVRRVLARVACVRVPAASPEGRARMCAEAAAHLPPGRAGDFNQALMDLGASICVSRRPRCESCPLESVCEARRRGLQNRIPKRSTPKPRPHFHSRAAVVIHKGTVALMRRARSSLLGGLWEFPKSRQAMTLPSHRTMARELRSGSLHSLSLKSPQGKPLATVEHTYSHFSITVHAFVHHVRTAQRRKELLWVPLRRLSSYPMGKVDRTIATRLQQLSQSPK